MLTDRTALIKDLERFYTISNEKPNLYNQLQTLSEEELKRVVGGALDQELIGLGE